MSSPVQRPVRRLVRRRHRVGGSFSVGGIRLLMLVRQLPDQRTGGDAYSPSKASNPIIPIFPPVRRRHRKGGYSNIPVEASGKWLLIRSARFVIRHRAFEGILLAQISIRRQEEHNTDECKRNQPEEDI